MRSVSTKNAYGPAEGPVSRAPAQGPPGESANFMSETENSVWEVGVTLGNWDASLRGTKSIEI